MKPQMPTAPSADLSRARVAIVCDWLKDRGGAELVLRDLVELFPDADIYASVYFPEKFDFLKDRKVFTSAIQRVPFFSSRPKLASILRPRAFESFDLSEYDLVISSASAEAKGVITRPETLHVCYCHTPTRYYWSQYHEYLSYMEFGWLNPLVRALMPRLIHRLRLWDTLASMRPDAYVANSAHVARRIAKYYRREAAVIHPGVETDAYVPDEKKDDFHFAIGRVIPYKRFDLLVDAFARMPTRRLVIATSTPNPYARGLMARSTPNVEWIIGADDAKKAELYRKARAFLLPQEEDFGLTPIEAMACGTPVIAYAKGAALETVSEGVTGTFFDEQTPASVIEAVERSEKTIYDPGAIRERARQFDRSVFKTSLRAYLEKALAEHREKFVPPPRTE